MHHHSPFTTHDIELMAAAGIKPETALQQLHRFKTGFPFLKISQAAGIGTGILHLSPDEETAALKHWNEFLDNGGTVVKFVPASGAASRMFKALFEFVDGSDTEPKPGTPVANLLDNIHKLAFFESLNIKAIEKYGENIDTLLSQQRCKDVVALIIKEEGLNYGNLPKGLLLFHGYSDGARTPMEEQLVEGALTARGADGTVRVHFTVSPNHLDLFKQQALRSVPKLEKNYGVKYDVSFSVQKSSTDTIAANDDNSPFRDNGRLVFRPGGHGSLIGNLNDLDSEVIFIKNIDNVVPDRIKEATVKYKKVLGGILIETQHHIADYLAALDNENIPDSKLAEITSFVKVDLRISPVPTDRSELIAFLRGKLNRPIRVCGMVRNDGEPGGGPFIASGADGTLSPQILESTQIDLDKPEYKEMLATATHFNPVDLVCYVKDTHGNPFNLLEHVDPNTGFISSKSFKGKTLKALELPGLWNGAMSDWNTIFVEIPSETFNPVKTVNDLLRPTHL